MQVGKSYKFELSGTRSSYDLTATITEIRGSEVVLVTDDSRRLNVPIAAVKSAVPIKAASPPKMGDSRSQGDVARGLVETLQAADRENDQVKQVQIIVTRLARDAELITSALNRQRAEAILAAARRLEALLKARHEAAVTKARAEFLSAERRARKIRRYHGRPGTIPAALDDILEALVEIERVYSESASSEIFSAPRILTRDTVNVTRGSDSEFDLPIRVSLDQPSATVRNVRLVLDKYRSLKLIGNHPVIPELNAGETVTLMARMKDNRRQGIRTDVRVEAHLSFTSPAGPLAESPRQTLRVKIHGKEEHQEIENPFRAYAGGLPVVNREMFFGRREIIDEFVKELGKPPGGMCYALYGQQRTGKSSVLEQVKSRLTERGAIVASLSMGTIDRRSMTVDFIEEILSQFRVQIHEKLPPELSSPLFARWPDNMAIERRPLRSLQRAREAASSVLRKAGHPNAPFVIVVDEFTYLHEILRRRGIEPREHNELRDFMRQLKGLLEARHFSALLVGQDTMPRFLDSYPNEFSVMTTRRLDYLSEEETQELADLPVRTPEDSTRYTGYALSTIAVYTDGHPFFTQILCDRIIELVNSKRRSDITETDVEEAVESLISGRSCIEPHKFDCLVSADNTHSLLSAMDQDQEGTDDGSRLALEVLRRIATLAGSQNNPVPLERLQLDSGHSKALDDLRMRAVVRESDSGIAIRVLLYADYLRRRTS